MVPMQKDNALSNQFAYPCFTILFILTGLITLASSMNLLVLRLATINAEEQVQEKLEAEKARRQAVHLEGDVISPNSRLFVTQEKPEQLETISVCSCACLDYKIWHLKRRKRSKSNMISVDSRLDVGSYSNEYKFFSIIRKSTPVKRLFNYAGKARNSKGYLNDSNQFEMKTTNAFKRSLVNNYAYNQVTNRNNNIPISFSGGIESSNAIIKLNKMLLETENNNDSQGTSINRNFYYLSSINMCSNLKRNSI
jgi:hypothetical protein